MAAARMLLLSSLFLVLPVAAHATLIGDEVILTNNHDGGSAPPSGTPVTVGAGVEYMLLGGGEPMIAIDIQESSISVFKTAGMFAVVGALNLEFTSLNWLGAPNGFITDVVLVLNGIAGLSQNDVSFTGDSITVTAPTTEGWGVAENGNGFDLLISTSHVPAPEPATALLLGLGLVGLASRRRTIA